MTFFGCRALQVSHLNGPSTNSGCQRFRLCASYLLFDCSRVLECAKIRTVCSLQIPLRLKKVKATIIAYKFPHVLSNLLLKHGIVKKEENTIDFS